MPSVTTKTTKPKLPKDTASPVKKPASRIID